MELGGKIWKDGKWWIIEVPCLNVSTQGRTRKEAFLMIKDAVLELMASYFSELDKKFKITIHEDKKNGFGLTSNDNKLLLAFSLIRQREESGLTIRDVAARLPTKSPNAYAQYERGKVNFSIDQYEKFTRAINPRNARVLRVV